MILNPYLNFPGNTEEAFNFYKTVFASEFERVARFSEMPNPAISKDENNKIMFISLPIGKQLLMGSDSLKSFGQTTTQGNNVGISVHPTTKKEADHIFTELSKGGKVEHPILDQPWGTYWGSLTDKFGIHWQVNFDPKA